VSQSCLPVHSSTGFALAALDDRQIRPFCAARSSGFAGFLRLLYVRLPGFIPPWGIGNFSLFIFRSGKKPQLPCQRTGSPMGCGTCAQVQHLEHLSYCCRGARVRRPALQPVWRPAVQMRAVCQEWVQTLHLRERCPNVILRDFGKIVCRWKWLSEWGLEEAGLDTAKSRPQSERPDTWFQACSETSCPESETRSISRGLEMQVLRLRPPRRTPLRMTTTSMYELQTQNTRK